MQDSSDAWPAFSLLRAGYIPPTPIEPVVAISIRSLKLFLSLMHVHLSFSSQSFACLLADMHNVSKCYSPVVTVDSFEPSQRVYETYLQTQVALMFDVFYSILLNVQNLVKNVMKHDTANYQMKHSCPACHYKVCFC